MKFLSEKLIKVVDPIKYVVKIKFKNKIKFKHDVISPLPLAKFRFS